MSDKEDSSSATGILALLYVVFHLITVVAYFDYHAYSTFGRWFLGLILMCIPVINSFFSFWGLINYWEMNWIAALFMVIAINIAIIVVMSNNQNNSLAIGNIIIIAIIMAACFSYCPKVINGYHVQQELERDIQAYYVNIENGRMSMRSVERKFKNILKRARIRAKRAGYAGDYDTIGFILKKNGIRVVRRLNFKE